MRFYTGIGSRETPEDILLYMRQAASSLASDGWTLRSGGADGADSAFEEGAKESARFHNELPKMEIYLPWKNFNKNPSPLFEPTKEALELASQFHPAWWNCSYGAKRLHARNGHQVLGLDLKTPSEFVVCWTKAALFQGGTAQAMRIATHHKIPIYNLANKDDLISFELERLVDRT